MADGADLVIRGGTIADGRGGELYEADIAVSGGRIVDVNAISLPHDNPHSWAGGTYAAAKLRSEVLSKQGTDVQIASGATYTSHAYLSSLQAALDAAGLHR